MSGPAQSTMIAAPMKTSDAVDWSPLRQYIREQYSDDPARYKDEFARLHQMREDSRLASDDPPSLDLWLRYSGQLQLLELRFPIQEEHISIPFSWTDSFTGKMCTQFNIAYEKACVLYNSAALLSHIGSSQNRLDMDGLKLAFNYFQCAAGTFKFVSDNFLHAPSQDLSPELLQFLSNLMLAQAQEVGWEKSVLDKRKYSIIAKLASQASFMYGNALKAFDDLKPKVSLNRDWQANLDGKAKHFGAVAHYYAALVARDELHYDEALGRLEEAERLSREAIRVTANIDPALQDIAKRNCTLIVEIKTQASKDNDLVYHQRPMKREQVSPVEKLIFAKPTILSEIKPSEELQRIIGPDLFARLIPLTVHQAASVYSEEVAKLVRHQTERTSEADETLAVSLKSLNLPELSRSLAPGDENLKRSLAECLEVIREAGGPQALESVVEQIERSRRSVSEVLSKIDVALDRDAKQCEEMRARFGPAWPQQALPRVANELRQELRRQRDCLRSAEAADASLLPQYREKREMFAKISSSGPALIAAAAQPRNLIDTDNEEQNEADLLAIIEANRKGLDASKEQRKALLRNLKEKSINDHITQILLLNQGKEKDVFAQQLKKYSPIIAEIDAAIERQEALLSNISATAELLSSKQASQAAGWRATMRSYVDAVQLFRKLNDGFREGATFYRDLVEQSERLSRTCDSFLTHRSEERAGLHDRLVSDKRHDVQPMLQPGYGGMSNATPPNYDPRRAPPAAGDAYARPMNYSPHGPPAALGPPIYLPGGPSTYRPMPPAYALQQQLPYGAPVRAPPPQPGYSGGDQAPSIHAAYAPQYQPYGPPQFAGPYVGQRGATPTAPTLSVDELNKDLLGLSFDGHPQDMSGLPRSKN